MCSCVSLIPENRMIDSANALKIEELLETKSMYDISKELSIPYKKIYHFCSKNNLNVKVKTKPGRKSKMKRHFDQILEDYVNGMSQASIAKKIGISRDAVNKIIKLSATETRSQSESAKMRESHKTEEERDSQTIGARAVRHAMSILAKFTW